MITVTFERKEDRVISFTAEGHAGYAEAGSDIVCAAVSAILITAANGVVSVLGIDAPVRQNDEIGFLQLDLPDDLTEEQRRDASLVLAVAQQGLQSVSEQYPGCVRVKCRNRR
ncbi:MAG: ribosomal-processing cysteine protease Prp [Eubacteriales bacterium]|nr:ribosomal-processing cysteine protease Prp [Eubacteriales bacterium]